MGYRFNSLAITVLLVVLGQFAWSLDVPLTYKKYAQEPQEFVPSGYGHIQKSRELPEGDWNIPKLKSRQPIYAILEMGESRSLLILDKKKADSKFYDLAYYDANNNHNLTDDTPISGEAIVQEQRYNEDVSWEMRQSNFPPVDITVKIDGTELPYRIFFNLYYYGPYKEPLEQQVFDENLNLSFRTSCAYRGEFDLNGKHYQLLVSDRDANGRFNDGFKLIKQYEDDKLVYAYPSGDMLFLSTRDSIDYMDGMIMPTWLSMAGQIYDVTVNIAKGYLRLTPTTRALAPLSLSMETDKLAFYTDDEKDHLVLIEAGKEVKVPLEKYRLEGYTVNRADPQGDRWRLSTRASGNENLVDVSNNQGAQYQFGEPYKVRITTNEADRRDSTVRLYFNVEGAAGESVSDLRHVSGDRTRIVRSEKDKERPKEPTFKVFYKDGKVASSGKFEYG